MVAASGVYRVKKSGLEFEHSPRQDDVAVSPEAFLKQFRDGFEMRVLENPSPNEMVLEMVHVDTSFVNALRRILLAEIPTVAIEHVYMWNNTSIIHDEVLSHRLGLIPLQVDARRLDEPDEEDDSPTDRNTVVFRMMVHCNKPPKQEDEAAMTDVNDVETSVAGADGASNSSAAVAAAASASSSNARQRPVLAKDRPYTRHVYSGDLEWVPQGEQAERFRDGIRPIHDDILVAKLRPGQAIELEAHARRGIGRDHAKYSPVATASYRLMPRIELLEDVYDELAEELVHVYEPGVFDLVEVSDVPGRRCKAVLVNPYACTMSRNFMRNPELKKAISISRIPDHFIFSIESVGQYKPAVLLADALRLLQQKCFRLSDLVAESEA